MNNKLQKYKIGDIIQHKEDETFKRKIICIFDNFYDETGYSTEIYYQTIIIENNNIPPPTPIKESSIYEYYKILSS
jgi:hypothetical protein